MHTTLIVKPDAGDGGHDPEAIAAAFRSAGHAVRWFSTAEEEWAEALSDPGDLVVAAGGDGTVEKVARRLAGRTCLLAVLPLGTANNVARALGFADTAEELAVRALGGRWRPVDMGVVHGPWGTARFLEAAGGGFFAEAIVAADEARGRSGDDTSSDALLRIDLRAYRRLVAEHRPAGWSAAVGGDPVRGPLLAVEVMNLPTVGPRIPLSPSADAGDGLLDVVMVPFDGRQALSMFLDACLAGDPPATAPFAIRRTRTVALEAGEGLLHADSQVLEEVGSGPIEIGIEAGALRILAG